MRNRLTCPARVGRRWAAILLVCGLTGCVAMPRIVVLTDPLTPQEHLQLGLLREADGRWEEAIDEYQAALAGHKTFSARERAEAWGALGNAHRLAGNRSAAGRAYRKSLHLWPDNAPILNNLAHLYLEGSTRLGEAALLARQAMALDPARRGVYLITLGSIHATRGETGLARTAYQEAIALMEAEASPWLSAARIEIEKHRVRRQSPTSDDF